MSSLRALPLIAIAGLALFLLSRSEPVRDQDSAVSPRTSETTGPGHSVSDDRSPAEPASHTAIVAAGLVETSPELEALPLSSLPPKLRDGLERIRGLKPDGGDNDKEIYRILHRLLKRAPDHIDELTAAYLGIPTPGDAGDTRVRNAIAYLLAGLGATQFEKIATERLVAGGKDKSRHSWWTDRNFLIYAIRKSGNIDLAEPIASAIDSMELEGVAANSTRRTGLAQALGGVARPEDVRRIGVSSNHFQEAVMKQGAALIVPDALRGLDGKPTTVLPELSRRQLYEILCHFKTPEAVTRILKGASTETDVQIRRFLIKTVSDWHHRGGRGGQIHRPRGVLGSVVEQKVRGVNSFPLKYWFWGNELTRSAEIQDRVVDLLEKRSSAETDITVLIPIIEGLGEHSATAGRVFVEQHLEHENKHVRDTAGSVLDRYFR